MHEKHAHATNTEGRQIRHVLHSLFISENIGYLSVNSLAPELLLLTLTLTLTLILTLTLSLTLALTLTLAINSGAGELTDKYQILALTSLGRI